MASAHGLTTSRDFAIFHDFGYKGLYNEETARDIATRKGVPKGRILDYMGSEELAANGFRITQAESKLRKLADEGVTGKTLANQTHYDMGKDVRQFILDHGGTPPSNCPRLPRASRSWRRRPSGVSRPSGNPRCSPRSLLTIPTHIESSGCSDPSRQRTALQSDCYAKPSQIVAH